MPMKCMLQIPPPIAIAPALAQAHWATRELAATIRPEMDRATKAASVATMTESTTKPAL